MKHAFPVVLSASILLLSPACSTVESNQHPDGGGGSGPGGADGGCAPTGFMTDADGCAESCPSPVCGSDGKIHASACAAPGQQADAYCGGNPPVLSGYFFCQGRYCRSGAEMCVEATGQVNAGRCLPLPAACAAAPSCACLVPSDYNCYFTFSNPSSNRCGSCQASAAGDITLVEQVP